MVQILKKTFGVPEANYSELFLHGAQIVDVRTIDEYQQGHIRGSINIPLQTLGKSFGKIKKDKPVITCCASGMRSAAAKGILKSAGYSDVYNGGGWSRLQKKL